MVEKDVDAFDVMKSFGIGTTRAIVYAAAILTYLSRRAFFLELLDNDLYRLGFAEGIGLTILIFGQISQYLRPLHKIWSFIQKYLRDD